MICAVSGGFLVLAVFLCIWDWLLKRKPMVSGRQKKCVFITGCDTGFGNRLALRLDAKGVPVFAGCFTKDGARDLKHKASDRLQTVSLDVASTDSVAKAYDFVQNHLPLGTELWGIVNNAGSRGLLGPLEFLNREAFRDLYEINLVSLMDLTRVFLPLLKKSGGRVVNTSSSIALRSIPGFFPYLTSKHAVRAFSSALRAEKAIHGIKVACIMPSRFQTSFLSMNKLQENMQDFWNTLPCEIQEEFGDEFVEKSMGLLRDFMKDAPSDVTPVIDAYEHALFAQSPRDEYVPGAEWNFLALSLLPPLLLQYVLKRFPWKVFAADPIITH